MKNVLITGSAGFIGFHTALKFIENGFNVVGIDNINSYYSVDLKYDRLEELGIHRKDVSESNLTRSNKFDNFSFLKLDIISKDELFKLFENSKFDYVVHLAAQAGVRYSLENPSAYVDSNIAGYLNILEACRNYPVQHLVYASSSSVYGNNIKTPFEEDDRVESPVSLYAATKRSNELMAFTYNHLYQINTTGLRFFTVYGPWGRPDMAPMLFADAISKGEAIKVFNNGDLQRDFTFVKDIVHGVYLLTISKKSTENQIFNIGNSKPVNLMEFISTLENAFSKKANLTMKGMQKGDVYSTYADVNKLEKEIGYNPTTNLKEGIALFAQWYNNYFNKK